MIDPLTTAVIVAALLLSAWGLLWSALDRAPGTAHLIGLGVLSAGILALAVTAPLGGDHPAEVATFIGYSLTTVMLPPAAGSLARMEPTRWGSLIIGVACLIVPVLVVRMQQVWNG